MRLVDTATGDVREIAPGAGRPLRVRVRGGARAHVTADLLRRYGEARRWRVAVDSASGSDGDGNGGGHARNGGRGGGNGGRDDEGLTLTSRQLLALNVHPGVETLPGPGPDVDVLDRPGAIIGAAVTVLVAAHAGGDGIDLLGELVDSLDPLCVRLGLLQAPYRDRVELGRDALKAAAGTLTRWRGLVAAWAEQPSAAMAPGYVSAVLDALGDDLDAPAALAVLERLAADDDVPPGARFETFAHLDRLLGLDLARDVGRAPRR